MPNISLTTFKIQTNTASLNTATIYNNGNMQAPVVISLVAMDGNKPYTLSAQELDTVTVVPFFDVSSPLPEGWAVSKQKNEYNHHVKGGVPVAAQVASLAEYQAAAGAAESLRVAPQIEYRWVTCAGKVESQNLAASVVIDGQTYTTNDFSGGISSRITVTSIQHNTYTGADMDVRKIGIGGCDYSRDGADWHDDMYAVLFGLRDGTRILDWSGYQDTFYKTPYGINNQENFHRLYTGFTSPAFTDHCSRHYSLADYLHPGECGGGFLVASSSAGESNSHWKDGYNSYQDITFTEEYGTTFKVTLKPTGRGVDSPDEEGFGADWTFV